MQSTENIQQPIGSGFDAASTTDDVIKGIDLTGKTAIVTGGYAGLGLETVKTFVKAGASVIVPVRDKAKAVVNLQGIENVTIEEMDLMDPVSINDFAGKFLVTGSPLHLLINNAGIMWSPLIRDKRGYESLLGYGQSKTANILFTRELDRRGKVFGVRSFTLHPGAIVDTDMKRLLPKEKLMELGIYDKDGNTIYDPSKGLKTIPQGASTIVWCATSPQLENTGGLYCENNEIATIDETSNDKTNRNSLNLHGVMRYAVDPESAKRLWTVSEELTETTFDI